MNRSRSWSHRVGPAALAALLVAAACGGSDLATESPTPPIVRVVLDAPGPITAAVVEIGGGLTDNVVVDDGIAFGERTGNTFRAVMLLDAPGVLRFSFGAQTEFADLDMTLVDVADAQENSASSLDGYLLRLER